jgi:hypothetical protein
MPKSEKHIKAADLKYVFYIYLSIIKLNYLIFSLLLLFNGESEFINLFCLANNCLISP